MFKVVCLFFLVLFSSCKIHNFISSVNEFEQLSGGALALSETIEKAVIERDYKEIERIILKNYDINTPFPHGKNALYMAMEGRDFQMVVFLLSHSANPTFKLSINGAPTSPYCNVISPLNDSVDLSCQDLLKLPQEEKSIFKSIFDGEIEEVSGDLFYRSIDEISNNGFLNIVWLKKLYELGVGLESLTDREFDKYFLKKGSKASNRNEFYKLLVSKASSVLIDRWKAIVEKPFVSGRYKRGLCKFYEQESCIEFEGFLQSCEPAMAKKLRRAQSKIQIYLDFRNRILNCSFTSSIK